MGSGSMPGMDVFAAYLWGAGLAVGGLGMVIGGVWFLGSKAEDDEGRSSASRLMAGSLLLSLTLGVFSIATIYIDTIGVFRDAESF